MLLFDVLNIPVAFAQKTDSLVNMGGVLLQEVLVKEMQQRIDPAELIKRMQNDTTFYKAFKTLRITGFNAYNDIEVLGKGEEVIASLNSLTQQIREGNCRTMRTLHQKVTGDFYKPNGNFRYRTAELYAHLFFTKGKICGEHNRVGGQVPYTGTAKYEEQLRRLIFNPGQRIRGIPGMGDNVAIFEYPERDNYRFYLKKEIHETDSVYIFTAIPKPGYEKDAVFRRLETHFRPSDWAIIARHYQLHYKTWVYDFDVAMSVHIKEIGKNRVPYWVSYRGNWHVFTQKREKIRFTAIFSDFH